MPFFDRLRYAAANGLLRLSKVLGAYMDPNTGWFLMDSSSASQPGGKYVLPAPPKSLLDEYQAGAWCYACVSIKARAVASFPWLLKRVVKSGPDEVVTDHPVVRLLERPMPKRTFSQFIEAWVSYKELSGTAFIEKVRRSRETVPVGLAPLRSDRVSRKVNPGEGVYEYLYRPNASSEQPFRVEDVIDDSYFNPISPDGGLAPTLPAWIMIQLDKAATSWNWDFFRNGAQPDIILSTEKPLPVEIMTRIEASFEAKNRNATGRGRGVHLVPYGVKADQVSPTHRDMQFERLLAMDRAGIAAVYGVPPVLLGLETLNYATADVQLRVFRDWKALPLFRSLLEVLTIEVVEEFPDGEDLYLAVDEEAVKTADERAAEANAVIQDFSVGIISRPEARVKRGYSAEEGVPAEGPGGRDRGGVTSAGDGSEDARIEQKPEQAAQEAAQARPDAKPAEGAEGGETAPAQKRGRSPDRPRTPYRLAKAREPLAAPIERRMQAEAAKRLSVQKGKLLAGVRRELGKSASGPNGGGNGIAPHDGDGADDDEEHARRAATLLKADEPAPKIDLSEEEILRLIAAPIAEQFKRAIADAVEAGGGTAGDALGIDFRATDEDVVDFYERQAAVMIKDIDESTARMVRDSLAAGHRDGDSEVDLMRRIEDGGAFAPSRAMRIARTETHRGMQGGHDLAFRQAGVTKRSWITAMDGAVREIHRSMHGQERDIDEPFEDGDGNELMYPGDIDAPPESSVNCRCTTIAAQPTATADELAEALDLLPSSGDEDDRDEGVEDKVREAVGDLPRSVAGRVDPDDVRSMRYEVGAGRDADYDLDSRTLMVGPRARKTDLQDAVREHLIGSLMDRGDARGVYNQLVAANLTDRKAWGEAEGTDREKAVRLVAAGATGDRAGVEGVLGRKLDADEWETARIISGHFLGVGRAGRGVEAPERTEPK